jgi:glycosyltransferase involved in cell wall biosynthesis
MIEPDLPDKMLEAFADALCSLATDPEGRREMGRRARNRIETEFRWTQKGTFMEMLFEHLETEA